MRVKGWVGRISAIGLVPALVAASGCSTLLGEKPEGPPTRVQYTLIPGTPVAARYPLPERTDIQVEWLMSDGSTATYPGFRGWGFLGNGRYQMVEVLNESGETDSYVYDVNDDGVVDLIRSRDARDIVER